MKIRLHQFLSKCGIFSSKNEIKNAIWDGKITVNGSIVKNISFEFNPEKKKVIYDKKELSLPQNEKYFLLNKPMGFICSRLNSQERKLGKKSIYELFYGRVSKIVYESLITVGRLDENTTGFLLVTTDGKLAHKITNPKNKIKKTYYIETTKSISLEQIDSIKNGIKIKINDNGKVEEYISRPTILTNIEEKSMILTIDEGKKREIRRMFDSVGNEVSKLHRLSTEKMLLNDYKLELGEYCEINFEDINRDVFSNIKTV
jgi:pseudouridine synthase